MMPLLAQGSSVVPFFVGALAVLFPGGVAALYKLRPEKRALVITEVEGATKILNGVIEALETQHDRDQETIAQLRSQLIEARRVT